MCLPHVQEGWRSQLGQKLGFLPAPRQSHALAYQRGVSAIWLLSLVQSGFDTLGAGGWSTKDIVLKLLNPVRVAAGAARLWELVPEEHTGPADIKLVHVWRAPLADTLAALAAHLMRTSAPRHNSMRNVYVYVDFLSLDGCGLWPGEEQCTSGSLSTLTWQPANPAAWVSHLAATARELAAAVELTVVADPGAGSSLGCMSCLWGVWSALAHAGGSSGGSAVSGGTVSLDSTRLAVALPAGHDAECVASYIAAASSLDLAAVAATEGARAAMLLAEIRGTCSSRVASAQLGAALARAARVCGNQQLAAELRQDAAAPGAQQRRDTGHSSNGSAQLSNGVPTLRRCASGLPSSLKRGTGLPRTVSWSDQDFMPTTLPSSRSLAQLPPVADTAEGIAAGAEDAPALVMSAPAPVAGCKPAASTQLTGTAAPGPASPMSWVRRRTLVGCEAADGAVSSAASSDSEAGQRLTLTPLPGTPLRPRRTSLLWTDDSDEESEDEVEQTGPDNADGVVLPPHVVDVCEALRGAESGSLGRRMSGDAPTSLGCTGQPLVGASALRRSLTLAGGSVASHRASLAEMGLVHRSTSMPANMVVAGARAGGRSFSQRHAPVRSSSSILDSIDLTRSAPCLDGAVAAAAAMSAASPAPPGAGSPAAASLSARMRRVGSLSLGRGALGPAGADGDDDGDFCGWLGEGI